MDSETLKKTGRLCRTFELMAAAGATSKAWGSLSAGLGGPSPITHCAFSLVVSSPPLNELLDHLLRDYDQQEAAGKVCREVSGWPGGQEHGEAVAGK